MVKIESHTATQASRFTAILLVLVFAGCTTTKQASTTVNSLPATSLRPFGRTALENEKLVLISSAAHVGFSFSGTECRVTASVPQWMDHNYLQYELDGVYQKRVRVSSKAGEPLVITTPSPGRHTVWLYKATEAQTGPVYLEKITGNALQVLQRPAAALIEFIGNSITCGAAADPSEVPCGTGVYHDQHNAYMAYGPRVARALGANYLMSCVSGIGAYRNWNSDGPTMPQVYEKLDFQAANPVKWDFSAYTPEVVSIALGTNDFSRGDGKKERLPFDSARFVNAYTAFVKTVQQHYPSAQIALLSSPMLNGEARALLQRCLTAVQHAINTQSPAAKPVAVFFFEPMQPHGCSGHPNVEDHAVLAAEIEPFFRKLLP